MAEIKRDPIRGDDGDSVIFDAGHTHCDILRYVIADVGADDAEHMMNLLAKEARDNG